MCSLSRSNLMQVLLVRGGPCFGLRKLPCCSGHRHVKSIWEKGVGERDLWFLTTFLQEVTHITCHVSLVRTSPSPLWGCKGGLGYSASVWAPASQQQLCVCPPASMLHGLPPSDSPGSLLEMHILGAYPALLN